MVIIGNLYTYVIVVDNWHNCYINSFIGNFRLEKVVNI